MTDYGTIKIPQDAYERHNKQRKELRLTWAEYIDGEAPNIPNGGEVPNIREISEEIKKHVNQTTTREAKDMSQKELDRLYARLEELETNLKNEIEALQGGRV